MANCQNYLLLGDPKPQVIPLSLPNQRPCVIPTMLDPIILVDGGFKNDKGNVGGVIFVNNRVLMRWSAIIHISICRHSLCRGESYSQSFLGCLAFTLSFDRCHICTDSLQLVNNIHTLLDSQVMGL